MKRILTIIFVLTSVFCSIFIPMRAQAQNLILPQGDFADMRATSTAWVSEVVTPLIVKMKDGRFVHLTGLDYPDLDPYNPGPYSVLAQKILTDFLVGQKVTLYQTITSKAGRTNRMGHHIAHLVRYDDQTWAQGMILALGLARVRTTEYTPDMAGQMMALEKDARQKNEGIWDIESYRPLSPDEANNHIGSFQIIEGTIKSVSMVKNRLYLNFGQNWRDDFTVSISAFDLRKFAKQNIDLQQWNGRRVRVRGWLESYNGPYMQIDHPERLELTPTSNKSTTAKPKKEKTLEGSALPAPYLND